MFGKGITDSDIKIHKVFLLNNKKLLPEIGINDNDELSALIPLPQDEKLLFHDFFWKNKYFNVVYELVSLYLENMENKIFQYHNLFLSDLALHLKSKTGGKVITHLHCLPWKFSSDNNPPVFNRLYQLYSDKKYKEFKEFESSKTEYASSDMIIALSEAAKRYLINIHDVHIEKIKIVPNGLENKALTRNSVREQTVILYVGKISRDKGTFNLLKALKTVKGEGYDFKLVLAGTISDANKIRIRNDYRMLDIDILGEVDFIKLQELYSSCTIGIIPSLHEQCSYVALEMAMFGVPMIVSKVDALGEMFEHEKTALLTPLVFDRDFGLSHDNEKFAENIIRLLSDKNMREKLSMNVKSLYERDYTLKKMIERTMDIYRQLI